MPSPEPIELTNIPRMALDLARLARGQKALRI